MATRLNRQTGMWLCIAALLILAVLLVPWASVAASSSFEGARVTFLTERLVHQEVLAERMAEIAEELGIDFRVQYLTSGDLRNKTLLDFTAGASTWDLVYTQGVRGMYEYLERGVIVPLDPYLEDDALRDPRFSLDDFVTTQFSPFVFNGQVMALPTNMSVNVLAYRKDLFNSAIEQEAFRERYGYDLVPPQTYEQFYDVAEFFTRKAGESLDGKVLEQDFYGTNFSNKPGTQLWNDYVNIMMAFGVEVYDRDTMRPTWNSPENVAAAEFYVSLVPFLHPAHINATSGEAAAQMATGNVAMMIEYFDRATALFEDPAAPVYGQVGYTLPPTKEGGRPDRQNAFRMGPPPIGIFAHSRNKEAAYKLLEQALLPENVKRMALASTGYLPILESVLHDPDILAARPYLSYLEQAADPSVAALTDIDVLGYPVILDFAAIVDIANASLSNALTGQASVRDALDRAQKELEDLFIRLGY